MAFVKMDCGIIFSSMWELDSDVRIAWFTLLALSDSTGHVRITAPGLAHAARIPIGKAREALQTYQAPDEDSRNQDHDGRRIKRVKGGYQILNYLANRNHRDDEARRERQRVYAREKRAAERAAADSDEPGVIDAPDCPDGLPDADQVLALRGKAPQSATQEHFVHALAEQLGAVNCPESVMTCRRHLAGALARGVPPEALSRAVASAKPGAHVWEALAAVEGVDPDQARHDAIIREIEREKGGKA